MFFASSISCQNALIHPIVHEKVLYISFENEVITVTRPVPEISFFLDISWFLDDFSGHHSLRKIDWKFRVDIQWKKAARKDRFIKVLKAHKPQYVVSFNSFHPQYIDFTDFQSNKNSPIKGTFTALEVYPKFSVDFISGCKKLTYTEKSD